MTLREVRRRPAPPLLLAAAALVAAWGAWASSFAAAAAAAAATTASGYGEVSETTLSGLKCSVESVDQANAAQLHWILAELVDSTFFRLVRVNGDGMCPLDGVVENAPTCGSEPGAAANPFQPSLHSPPQLWSTPSTMTSMSISPPGESLCSVEGSPQKVAETVVTKMSVEEVSAQSEFPRDHECVIEGTFFIRPDYWLDICDESNDLGPADYVNLRLNPERNTGYNGSTVWAGIHAAAATLDSEEGRVLQRLMFGYHTSVTTQIMANYFPGSKGAAWQPNADKFAAALRPHPQRLRDMQFAFVVMARSLFKIKDYLYRYHYATGNEAEDQMTLSLMRHLLDTSVLSSCGSVVMSGFDESVMFHPDSAEERAGLASQATRFKQAFRRISRMVNCVTCKRCKLHASVALHGIGVGIKILLTDPALVIESISRDDIVALVNTVQKLSESMELAKDLLDQADTAKAVAPAAAPVGASVETARELGLVAVSQRRAQLTRVEEDALVHALVQGDERVVLLAKALLVAANDSAGFMRHALIALDVVVPDAVVVGGGLAGLVTAISVADRGGSVVVLEKQATLGGNSAKASSGINSVRSNSSQDLDAFLQDTLRSQGGHGEVELAQILIHAANTSVSWLERVTGVDLTSVGQLGGHRSARTWKPEHGVVGAELMAALIRVVKERSPFIRVVTHARATELVVSDGRVEGVVYIGTDGRAVTLPARAVVLASGGFGFDAQGLLRAHRPDLVGFPTTLGAHTTGDGIRLAAAAGAQLVDMEYVQLHPTGFVDPADRDSRVKVLAAEVLRGVGGVMLDAAGRRFVNELGTRKHVTDRMLAHPSGSRTFWLVLSDASAALAPRLTSIYEARGLLHRVGSAEELQRLVGGDVLQSLRAYSDPSTPDAFGREDKAGLPLHTARNWLVGEVTAVVHYTMGGVKIDASGRVVGTAGHLVPGLFAVGEVAGGVHGENRLGGNSLLECTVFGRVIGAAVEVAHDLTPSHFSRTAVAAGPEPAAKAAPRAMSRDEVAAHGTPVDCWTIIEGKVYDLSQYAQEHPGGEAAIRDSCGGDCTNRFLVAHTRGLLQDVGFLPVGAVTLLAG